MFACVRGACTQQGKEIIDGLGRCTVDALKHYFKVNNFLPDRIIIYRDGVGDGMLQLVVPSSLPQRTVCSTMAITMLWGVQADHEITQLHDAFAKIGPTYKPRLAVVVVKKRIHTRIFAHGTYPPNTTSYAQLSL
jgi:aubergine-like protein